MEDKSLIEVSLDIKNEFVEPISYVFKKYCDYDFVIEENVEFNPDENETKPFTSEVTIKGYIKDNASQKDKIAYIEGGVSLIRLVAEVPELNIKKILTSEWTDQKFPSIEIGKNFIISSDFCDDKKDNSKIIININPGLGFGTGHHPTTKMMLEQIEKLDFSDRIVLDFGCGSGILSIAAKKMNSKKIIAIDIDEYAIKSSKENISRSKLENIDLRVGSIEALSEDLKFDYIFANISSSIIQNFAEVLKNKLSNNGLIICSGILLKNKSETINKLKSVGFILIDEKVEKEWVCIVLK
jgi:ribosomal protein L11 methyltransferase